MIYIAALLGMELFANTCRFDENSGNLIMDVIKETEKGTLIVSPRDNFDTIGNALTTVFILILGEDWPGIMYNYVRVYGDAGHWVVPYFIIVFSAGNLMLLSLFTAILLQNFEGGEDDDDEEEDPNKPLEKIIYFSNDDPKERYQARIKTFFSNLKYIYFEAFGSKRKMH